jgi:hypothetical protein
MARAPIRIRAHVREAIAPFARARATIGSFVRGLDWPLVILIVGFVVVAPIFGGSSGGFNGAIRWLTRLVITTPTEAYEQSIAAAAVKRPNYDKKLQTIDTSKPTVKVVTFRTVRAIEPKDRTFDIWVALPDQLRNACKGAKDPVRTLQQVLGLPPTPAADRVVTEIEVPPSGLFRPCFAGGDITKDVCELVLPAAAPTTTAVAAPPPQPPDQIGDAAAQQKALKEALDQLTTLRGKYDHLHFVAEQMWTKYRVDFKRPDSTPNYGYPFTGMGWTYDWSTRSRDHVGVSELIVKRDAEIKIVSDTKPADFCK